MAAALEITTLMHFSPYIINPQEPQTHTHTHAHTHKHAHTRTQTHTDTHIVKNTHIECTTPESPKMAAEIINDYLST